MLRERGWAHASSSGSGWISALELRVNGTVFLPWPFPSLPRVHEWDQPLENECCLFGAPFVSMRRGRLGLTIWVDLDGHSRRPMEKRNAKRLVRQPRVGVERRGRLSGAWRTGQVISGFEQEDSEK